VVARSGRGRGGVVAAIRLWTGASLGTADLGNSLRQLADVSGALGGIAATATEAPQQTRERGLRRGDLEPPDAVLLLELSDWPAGKIPMPVIPGPLQRTRMNVYRLEHEVSSNDAIGG